MSLESRQNTSNWVSGSIFFFFALLLFGFHLWLRFFVLSETAVQLDAEKVALESVKAQQGQLLGPDLRDLFEQYSQGFAAVESLLLARDDVFSGSMTEDKYEPVMLLNYPEFLELLQERLGKQSFLSNMTIDSFGKVSFLIQTTSFFQAAQQIAALRFGFQEQASRTSQAEESPEEASQEPPLFVEFGVWSVASDVITGKAEELPDFLRENAASYNFVVQMRVNPEYYAYHRALELEVEENPEA